MRDQDPRHLPTGAERRRFYDSTAGLYAATWPWIWRFGFRSLHHWLAEVFQGCHDILDAGAGTGYWAQHLASVEGRDTLVAMDFSMPYLEKAVNALPRDLNIQLVQGDINASPFADASFDAILCSGVLDTFPEPVTGFRELRRLLRQDGKLVLILRGQGGWISYLSERVIRSSIGVARAVRFHAWSARSVSTQVWNREPLCTQLPQLADVSDFRLDRFVSGRVLTRAVLVAIPKNAASRQKPRPKW